MYPSVKEVIPGDDYILSLTFDDGEHGLHYMKPYLDFGVFRKIRDYKAFS